MNKVTVDITNASINEIAELIDEITKEIQETQGKALENLDKKEKWYKRIFKICRFSKDNQKVILKNVYDTNVLLQILTILSKKIYEENHNAAIKFADCLIELKSKTNVLDTKVNDLEKIVKSLQEFIMKKDEEKALDLNAISAQTRILLVKTLNSIYETIETKNDMQIAYYSSLNIFFNKELINDEKLSDLSKLETIIPVEAKIFYKVLLEAIGILIDNELTDATLEKFSPYLGNLYVTDHIQKELRQQVYDAINNYFSKEYFIEKYKHHVAGNCEAEEFLDADFFDSDDEFICNQDAKSENDVELFDSGISDELNGSVFDYSGEPITEINKLEEQTLSGIMHIKKGAEKVFRGLNLHLQNTINCDGTLIFDSCVININETIAQPVINIMSTGCLKIVNCYIRNFAKANDFFIKVASNDEKDVIEFENCRFFNCCNFIDCGTRNIILKKCKITDQPIDFIHNANQCNIIGCFINISYKKVDIYTDKYIISGNLVSVINSKICSLAGFKNITKKYDWYSSKIYMFDNIVNIDSCVFNKICYLTKNCDIHATISNTLFDACDYITIGGEINNCKIEKCFCFDCNDCSGSVVKNSYFSHCSELSTSATVEECEFYCCSADEVCGWLASWVKNSYIEKCKRFAFVGIKSCVFNNCTNCYSGTGTGVSDSFFVSCYDTIFETATGTIENCFVINCFAKTGTSFFYINPKYELKIKNVSFYNCLVENGAYFFDNEAFEKEWHTTYLENCKFINCKSKNENNEIIKINSKVKKNKVDELFSRQRYKNVLLYQENNCLGMDRINRIDESIVLPEIPQRPNREYLVGCSCDMEEFFIKMDKEEYFPFI